MFISLYLLLVTKMFTQFLSKDLLVDGKKKLNSVCDIHLLKKVKESDSDSNCLRGIYFVIKDSCHSFISVLFASVSCD